MRRAMIRHNHKSGFTLLETLLSLALTGLIVGMTATLARQWLMNWNRGADRVATIEAITLTENRLATEIEAAIAFPFRSERPMPHFIGSENDIYFVRAPFSSEPSSPLRTVNFRNDPERGIIRRVALYDPARPLLEQSFGEAITLLPGPYRLTMRYRNRDGAETLMWQDKLMPEQLSITIADQTRPVTTPHAIVVNAALPSACSLTATLKECEAVMDSGKQPDPVKSQSKAGAPANQKQKSGGILQP